MKKQRLIALMCAGLITTASLTGCSSSNSKMTNNDKNARDLYSLAYIGVDDTYIVLEQNDVDVLHKGNMGVLFTDGAYAGGPTTDYNYSFDCGEVTISNATHALYEEMPDETQYDKICEDCFGK